MGCLFIALALNAMFSYAEPLAQSEPPWLQLNTHNPSNNATLKPQWTVIITSKKPMIKQIRENRWEIEFEH